MAQRAFITSHVKHFSETRNVRSLLKALALIVQQGRTLELMYGGYCTLRHGPSLVSACDDTVRTSIMNHEDEFLRVPLLTRGDLLQLYGAEFKVSSLPEDFLFSRCQAVFRQGNRLVIGEYGENSRIACVTPETCVISYHYKSDARVRHIHSVTPYGDADEFLVATGDGAKVLDLWVQSGDSVCFMKRLRRYLAGFTAVARVKGEYYFGSDFSGRPNFIETFEGTKYFFPAKAYKLLVTAFFVLRDRYLVSVNNELRITGGRKALSIFDAVDKRFIFCDYMDSPPLVIILALMESLQGVQAGLELQQSGPRSGRHP
jgi:hypothetical protein